MKSNCINEFHKQRTRFASGDDFCGQDVYPYQQPDRGAEQHHDFDDWRLRGVGNNVLDEPRGKGEVHDPRNVHADSNRVKGGTIERERQC